MDIVLESRDWCVVHSDPVEPGRTTFQAVAGNCRTSVVVGRKTDNGTSCTQDFIYSQYRRTIRHGYKTIRSTFYYALVFHKTLYRLTASGQSPQWGAGAEPLVRESGAKSPKFKHFLHYHNLWSRPICPKIYIFCIKTISSNVFSPLSLDPPVRTGIQSKLQLTD